MGRGDPVGRIMIIGEAPGANEEESGKVFSGRAGQLLDRKLRDAGLEPDVCYVTNVVKCRPPNNRTPERLEWEACRKYLEREVKAVRPTHVLLLGNVALRTVARTSGITSPDKRGVQLSVKDPSFASRFVMATIHPAYVLRNPGQDTVFSEDIRRFARATRGELQAVPVRTKLVTTSKGLRALINKLNSLPDGTVLAYDVENRYAPWHKDWSIQVLGVSWDGETTYVVPLMHPQSKFWKKWKQVLLHLKEALERPGLKLVGQNAKHDNVQLAGGKVFLEHSFDIMLAAHVVDENRPKNLGYLSQAYLGADNYKGLDLKPEKILKIPLRELSIYNGADVGYTHQLRPKLLDELKANPRSLRLFAKLLMPASHVIQQVEMKGMWVDREKLFDRIGELQGFIRDRTDLMREHMPAEWRDDFNFNSTQQVAKWLYSSPKKGGLGLDIVQFTKTGNPSTNEDSVIEYIAHPVVKALLEYRTLQLKWMNTYLAAWATKLDKNSRMHTTYKLYGTVTGRLSGDLQQVPRDTFVRSVIGAPPGWRFCSADYSQIELRIAAHVSGERRMKRAYILGEDLHRLTASMVTGKRPEDIGKEERKQAKAVNFGFLYGMYPKKFQNYAAKSYQIAVSLGEAELFRQKYFELYPDLLKWHERVKRRVNEVQYVTSPLGRVRHLPDVLSGDRVVRMEAERQAINSPVQGCATDMMLFSMVQLQPHINPQEAAMVMTNHDQIGFEIREDRVDHYLPIIKEVMENLPLKKTFGLDFTVPVVADVEEGQYWQGIDDAAGLGITGYS